MNIFQFTGRRKSGHNLVAIVLLHFLSASDLVPEVECGSVTSDISGCGEKKSCWFQPKGCELTDVCVSAVQWITTAATMDIHLQAVTRDLDISANGRYLALGFSKDDKMGEDTVVECVFLPDGSTDAFVSFNDQTYNSRLLQATHVMISNTTAQIIDGVMHCRLKWLFDRRNQVNHYDRFKVFELRSQPWTMQTARGYTKSYSGQKRIHSTNDGTLFPFQTTRPVHICSNCSQSMRFQHITDMKQTDFVNRFWRYRLAVIHGILLLIAWWILGSSAVLMSRFFKPIWSHKRFLGTAVWFQIHRDAFVLSVILQLIAVFFIFLQANFVWYQCSSECQYSSYSLQLHAILGCAAVVLASVQPLLALNRPPALSPARFWFNWLHWFLGTTAWLCATVSIFLSVVLGKTGLHRNFHNTPYHVMGAYVATYVLCTILLEILSSRHSVKHSTSSEAVLGMSFLNGPQVENPSSDNTYGSTRQLLFGVHLTAALAATVCLSYMLVSNLHTH